MSSLISDCGKIWSLFDWTCSSFNDFNLAISVGSSIRSLSLNASYFKTINIQSLIKNKIIKLTNCKFSRENNSFGKVSKTLSDKYKALNDSIKSKNFKSI